MRLIGGVIDLWISPCSKEGHTDLGLSQMESMRVMVKARLDEEKRKRHIEVRELMFWVMHIGCSLLELRQLKLKAVASIKEFYDLHKGDWDSILMERLRELREGERK